VVAATGAVRVYAEVAGEDGRLREPLSGDMFGRQTHSTTG